MRLAFPFTFHLAKRKNVSYRRVTPDEPRKDNQLSTEDWLTHRFPTLLGQLRFDFLVTQVKSEPDKNLSSSCAMRQLMQYALFNFS